MHTALVLSVKPGIFYIINKAIYEAVYISRDLLWGEGLSDFITVPPRILKLSPEFEAQIPQTMSDI